MTRPSGKIYTLSLFPAIDTTLYLEGMEPVRELPAQREHSEAGGKGANTAAALTALGLDCACICLMGEENAGLFLRLECAVSPSRCPGVSGRTSRWKHPRGSTGSCGRGSGQTIGRWGVWKWCCGNGCVPAIQCCWAATCPRASQRTIWRRCVS